MIASTIGHGPDLALIHGWGLGSASWEPVLGALAQRCRVHLIDLPGYGATPASDTDFTQTAQALIDALPDGISLCGWSLGGMLALQAALLAPQKVGRLILVGSTPSFMQRDHWPAAQPPELLDNFSNAIATDPAKTLQRFIALLNQGDTQARALGRTMLKQAQSAPLPGTATLLAGLGWLRDVDLRIQIAQITTPALLIHGACDPLMPLAAGQWLNGRLPHARLEIFPECAHAPFLADPAHFAALVGDLCHADAAR